MKKSKKRSGFGIVMGIICGILISGYIVVLATVSTYRPSYYYTSGSTYLRYINSDEYYHVVQSAQSDRRYENRSDADRESVKEFYAVADYVEAVAMYKAYKETGNVAKTEQYAAKIGEAQKGLNNLDFIKKDVNSILNIE